MKPAAHGADGTGAQDPSPRAAEPRDGRPRDRSSYHYHSYHHGGGSSSRHDAPPPRDRERATRRREWDERSDDSDHHGRRGSGGGGGAEERDAGRKRSFTTMEATSTPSVPANYVIEHMPPGYLFCLRNIERRGQSYTPLPARDIARALAQPPFTMSPPLHVAHQALRDFYTGIHGRCGVDLHQNKAREQQYLSRRALPPGEPADPTAGAADAAAAAAETPDTSASATAAAEAAQGASRATPAQVRSLADAMELVTLPVRLRRHDAIDVPVLSSADLPLPQLMGGEGAADPNSVLGGDSRMLVRSHAPPYTPTPGFHHPTSPAPGLAYVAASVDGYTDPGDVTTVPVFRDIASTPRSAHGGPGIGEVTGRTYDEASPYHRPSGNYASGYGRGGGGGGCGGGGGGGGSSRYYGKVCAFYNTRDGCRNGEHCSFLHVAKGA